MTERAEKEERLCKDCKHARPADDTSAEWRKRAVCHHEKAPRSKVDGRPDGECEDMRIDRQHAFFLKLEEICGAEGDWWEEAV